MLIQALVILYFFSSIKAYLKCSNESPSKVPKYYLMEQCYRSKLGIAAKANYTSLKSCHNLGIEKRALAVNFSPPEAFKQGLEIGYTCEVLKCAESDGGPSLVNDTSYDYYSIYAKTLPHVNSTCVPAIGMFYLQTERLNYTQALYACLSMSAVLADVTSEQRTDALAQLLVDANVDAALIGLRRRRNSSDVINTEGDSLSCTTYRAWAPGHPRRNYTYFDCVLITRQRSWQTTPCSKHYPALCELIPSGPYKKRSIFASRNPVINETIPSAQPEQN